MGRVKRTPIRVGFDQATRAWSSMRPCSVASPTTTGLPAGSGWLELTLAPDGERSSVIDR